jgi:flagellar hook assembly protein FlgD
MEVVIKIYDSRGKNIRDLLDETLPPGSYRIHWDGHSNSGAEVSSGIYLLSIRAGTHTAIRKMVLAR